MKRMAFALAFGIAAFFGLPRAEAQELGSKGDAIFGAERLFGIRGEHVDVDRPEPDNDSEQSGTTISIGFARTLVPYNIPRLGFDYAIVDHWTIGGALAYSNMDVD